MTTKEAVQKCVAYVDQAPAWDELAAALRVVLRDFKEQNIVALRLERIVHDFVKETEAAPTQGALFESEPERPVHPELRR